MRSKCTVIVSKLTKHGMIDYNFYLCILAAVDGSDRYVREESLGERPSVYIGL